MVKFLKSLKRILKVVWIVVAKGLSCLIPFKRVECSRHGTRCEYDFFNKSYRNAWFGLDSAPCCNSHLYELLRDITECLDQAQIPYFIFYGTLLGAIRHNGGFVPWDTDVDICLLEQDRDRCLKLFEEKLVDRYPMTHVNEVWSMLSYSKSNDVHADTYFMSSTEKDLYLKGYETIRYPIDDIFPLQRISVYDLLASCPNEPETIKHKYGSDFMKRAYRQYALWQRESNDFHPARLIQRLD